MDTIISWTQEIYFPYGHIRACSEAQRSVFCGTFWLDNLTSQPMVTWQNAGIWEQTGRVMNLQNVFYRNRSKGKSCMLSLS